MRKPTTIETRIKVRAYFAWLNGSTLGAVADWLAAERHELRLARRRVADASRRQAIKLRVAA